MKIKPEQIFIGDIKKCTKYKMHTTFSSSLYIGDHCIGCDSFGHIEEDSELYKENAVLIKIENGGYVDLEKLNSILDYIKIHRDIEKDGYQLGGLMIPTEAYCAGKLFVDGKTLKPYYNDKQKTNYISTRQLKKQIKSLNNKTSES